MEYGFVGFPRNLWDVALSVFAARFGGLGDFASSSCGENDGNPGNISGIMHGGRGRFVLLNQALVGAATRASGSDRSDSDAPGILGPSSPVVNLSCD